MKQWIRNHPDLWQFILFNLLSNCATVTNFVVMWLCTRFLFAPLADRPFSFLVFNYTQVERDLGLCGFLSFLTATAAAQTVNFFVQKNWVFRSNARFRQAVPKYILLALVLVVLSAAMPAYSQAFFIGAGERENAQPLTIKYVKGTLAVVHNGNLVGVINEVQLNWSTLATVVNVLLQIVISYPAMKFWIMPQT